MKEVKMFAIDVAITIITILLYPIMFVLFYAWRYHERTIFLNKKKEENYFEDQ
jgi:hypothetical protein